MINSQQLWALAPLLIPSIGVVVLMLQISFWRNAGVSYVITLLSLLSSMAVVPQLAATGPLQITPLLKMDDYALFFSLLFSASAAVTAVVSHEYLRKKAGQNEEYFLLLLLSTLGAITLAYATHLATLLLGMELMGVALYALIAYPDKGTLPLEAATKYLVLSGAASAMLLFGFALLYAGLGTMAYEDMAARIQSVNPPPGLLLTGAILVIAGLSFKLSLVPFHMWTPDVYEGAPAPISGFLATVSKGAVFVGLLRWYLDSQLYTFPGVLAGLSLLAGASMLVGNLLALRQENVKRTLAYSSIAHMGYLLMVLVACGLGTRLSLVVESASYYLVAYVVTSLAAFTLLGLLSRGEDFVERDQLQDMTGLFWRQPLLALMFSISLLSLAGIPLTAGFIGKFYIFTVGVDGAMWGLLWLLVIGSGIAIYYYLRIIFTMTKAPSSEYTPDSGVAMGELSAGTRWVLYLLIVSMLYLGVIPDPLMSFLRSIL
jgi:NADH-quinone oxidoreductase subunit N